MGASCDCPGSLRSEFVFCHYPDASRYSRLCTVFSSVSSFTLLALTLPLWLVLKPVWHSKSTPAPRIRLPSLLTCCNVVLLPWMIPVASSDPRKFRCHWRNRVAPLQIKVTHLHHSCTPPAYSRADGPRLPKVQDQAHQLRSCRTGMQEMYFAGLPVSRLWPHSEMGPRCRQSRTVSRKTSTDSTSTRVPSRPS